MLWRPTSVMFKVLQLGKGAKRTKACICNLTATMKVQVFHMKAGKVYEAGIGDFMAPAGV